MAEYRLPTLEGRELLIRPCIAASRPQLQLALISTYGNLIEAVTLEAGDAFGLARGAGRVARVAHQQHERHLRLESALAQKRYLAALARNPWHNQSREGHEQKGLR